MADTLATVYTNQRARVPGADTTNMPDATLLVLNKSIYRWLATNETGEITRIAGSTFGWTLDGGAGQRLKTTSSTTISRVVGVYYEDTDAVGVDGPPVEYVDYATWELEKNTYPGTNGPTKIAYWRRNDNGSWTIYIHPGGQAATTYLSIEGESDPTDLSGGASLVVLTPMLTEMLVLIGAYELGRLLGRDRAWLDALMATAPDRRIAAAWLSREYERGVQLPSPPERHGG